MSGYIQEEADGLFHIYLADEIAAVNTEKKAIDIWRSAQMVNMDWRHNQKIRGNSRQSQRFQLQKKFVRIEKKEQR